MSANIVPHGRKGRPNKNKQRLMNALKVEYGDDFDPIMVMAKNASHMQSVLNEKLTPNEEDSEDQLEIDKILALQLIPEVNKEWSRIAEYVVPKLKAVEIEISGDISVSDMTDYELAERLKEIANASESE